ncbi:MAG: hypothetical protein II336_15230 [Loktanella sp.]|nr:hypothetical protein [Loktanella sp.]
MRKYVGLFLSLCVLSACGGGGGDSVSQSVSINADPIRVFADGSGAGRVVARSGGDSTTGYILSPELTLVLEELRRTRQLSPVDAASFRIVDTGPNTTIRAGAFTQDGVTINVLGAITLDEDATLVLFEEPTFGDTILLSEGRQVTNMPTGGSATYSGVLGLSRFNGTPELGTFSATASFSGNPNITLSGSTASYNVNGTAAISGGSFSSSSMTIGNGFSNTSATMNGDFHGDGANSVAGIVYSNDSSAQYRGGFVGSQ